MLQFINENTSPITRFYIFCSIDSLENYVTKIIYLGKRIIDLTNTKQRLITELTEWIITSIY
jgi:hypothetical protein